MRCESETTKMGHRQGMGWSKWVRGQGELQTLNYPLATAWCVREVRMAAKRNHEGLDEAKMTVTFYSISFYFIVDKTLNMISTLLINF